VTPRERARINLSGRGMRNARPARRGP
jgi:DNA-binding CsgD family transcriptional regulator